MNPWANDTELLAALKKGNRRAFDHIYDTHYKALCFFAERMTGNTQQAEDIVADTFVKLVRNNPEFESLAKLKSYLYTITRNASLDYIRNEKRQQATNLEAEYLATRSEETDTEAVRAEVLQAIYSAIGKLPPKCRRIIQLSFIEGKKIEEIAAEMNIAYHTVQNQKTRGIKLLRLALFENSLLSPAILVFCLLYLSKQGIDLWDKTILAAL